MMGMFPYRSWKRDPFRLFAFLKIAILISPFSSNVQVICWILSSMTSNMLLKSESSGTTKYTIYILDTVRCNKLKFQIYPSSLERIRHQTTRVGTRQFSENYNTTLMSFRRIFALPSIVVIINILSFNYLLCIFFHILSINDI